MTIPLFFEAELAQLDGEYDLSAATAVAVPPSSIDPWEDEMRIRTASREVFRSFDPEPMA